MAIHCSALSLLISSWLVAVDISTICMHVRVSCIRLHVRIREEGTSFLPSFFCGLPRLCYIRGLLWTSNRLLSTPSSKIVTVRLDASLQDFPLSTSVMAFEPETSRSQPLVRGAPISVPRNPLSLSLHIDLYESTFSKTS